MEVYQKPSSGCFVCDRAPLYGILHGTFDHEVTHLPILVINRSGCPWCGADSQRRVVHESVVGRCWGEILSFAKSGAGKTRRRRHLNLNLRR